MTRSKQMKHKVKVQVPVEKRGLFGIKKIVMETRTIEVDDKTYKKMQQEKKNLVIQHRGDDAV